MHLPLKFQTNKSTYFTDVAKRLIASDTVFVCVASCCHKDASLEFPINVFEHSTIRHAPSMTFLAADRIGSCN
jgi:hypothetical protein